MFRIILALFLLTAAVTPAHAGVGYTKGYFRKNGTYVEPHLRTTPNKYTFDNLGSNYNYKPYKVKMPKQPKSYNYSYSQGSSRRKYRY